MVVICRLRLRQNIVFDDLDLVKEFAKVRGSFTLKHRKHLLLNLRSPLMVDWARKTFNQSQLSIC